MELLSLLKKNNPKMMKSGILAKLLVILLYMIPFLLLVQLVQALTVLLILVLLILVLMILVLLILILPIHLILVMILLLMSKLLVELLKSKPGLNTLIKLKLVIMLLSLEHHYQNHGKRLLMIAY